MTNSLRTPQVSAVLDRLFAAADEDAARPPRPNPGDAQGRADAMQDIYMPVSVAGGKLLYALTRAARPGTVVEFGTSYGISTIHLAAAVADNGIGHVYGSEMSATKLDAARLNIKEAGLGAHATILAGDARETFEAIEGPIGFVLLDGWKELTGDVLRLLEPKLAPGALVVADDITFPTMADHLAYVRDPANGYVSMEFPVEDGMEISCYTGA
ncbi:O-methyltransferase [Kibdelosporangium phytohabitans]|uniref:Methyltransferase n=1 Tax=Kibdelosporangium phytohabitans TaxID=860235 RepID=A0A0N9I3Q3_9PSEU|nr:class I SAM-dependent methyltransferase [Kibdelosporangium phytohabitans]ALG08905.1 methyltransferase [Kibdelosporangium phytohabitans]MBE1469939.1 putative O-methyltransferase YrrM [Kibdelosporangium phytohabitans]